MTENNLSNKKYINTCIIYSFLKTTFPPFLLDNRHIYLGGTSTPNFGEGTGFDTGIMGGNALLGGGLILLQTYKLNK